MNKTMNQGELFHAVMDVLIDVEKGSIDHIDGTAKVLEIIENKTTSVNQLNECSVYDARDFFSYKSKLEMYSVEFRYKSKDEALMHWNEGLERETIIDFIDEEIGTALAVCFPTVTLEVTDKEFSFFKDKNNKTLLISPVDDNNFDIWITVN